MTLETEVMVRVRNSCEQVIEGSYSPNATGGNQRNRGNNATFCATFLSQNRCGRPFDGLGFHFGALAAATGRSLLPFGYPHTRLDRDDSSDGLREDRAGEHRPMSARPTTHPPVTVPRSARASRHPLVTAPLPVHVRIHSSDSLQRSVASTNRSPVVTRHFFGRLAVRPIPGCVRWYRLVIPFVQPRIHSVAFAIRSARQAIRSVFLPVHCDRHLVWKSDLTEQISQFADRELHHSVEMFMAHPMHLPSPSSEMIGLARPAHFTSPPQRLPITASAQHWSTV